ncbi:hypothetical protein [Methylocapsa sp. S129]|uniref:hypothetical protein n=1 Tax=Methylocapsa sp. S129 TaxID=1641869 RepID=UPI00131C4568|nr:hypothetical protein [Methylocapsa sp. S129]
MSDIKDLTPFDLPHRNFRAEDRRDKPRGAGFPVDDAKPHRTLRPHGATDERRSKSVVQYSEKLNLSKFYF